MVRDVLLNGLKIHITVDTVLILDELDDVTDQEAVLIVNYLYNEGFIDRKDYPYEIIDSLD